MVLNYSRGLAEEFAGLPIQIGFVCLTAFCKILQRHVVIEEPKDGALYVCVRRANN